MDITLRLGTKKDFSFCFALTKVNMEASFIKNWGGWSEKTFTKHFSADKINMIYLDKRSIGYFSLSRHNTYWCLDDIQLLPSETNKGIGTALLSKIDDIVFKSDVKKVHLTVFVDNPAMRLYAREGFDVIKNKGPAVLMEKVVS